MRACKMDCTPTFLLQNQLIVDFLHETVHKRDIVAFLRYWKYCSQQIWCCCSGISFHNIYLARAKSLILKRSFLGTLKVVPLSFYLLWMSSNTNFHYLEEEKE